MSIQSPDPAASDVHAALEPTAENVRSRTGLVRYSVALAIAGLGWIVPFTGASGVLLPARIAQIDPVNKVGIVATVVAVGAFTAMIAAVVFGNLSDRTRTRLGKRGPWIIAGATTGAAAMYLLSTADSVRTLILWWAVYQAAQNAIGAVLIASIPDRVPTARRRNGVRCLRRFAAARRHHRLHRRCSIHPRPHQWLPRVRGSRADPADDVPAPRSRLPER
ncbi:MAG TPA: hypothetical protein PKB06_03085 [Actinotalea sp.]|nr:hypothetical protein [Actinotalea sp.]